MATQLDFNLPFASMNNMNQNNSLFPADKKFAQNPISNLKQSLNGFHVTTFNPFQSQATTGPTFGTTSPISNNHFSDLSQTTTPRTMMNQSLSSVKFNFDNKLATPIYKENPATQIYHDSVISQIASRLNAQFGTSSQPQVQPTIQTSSDQNNAYDSNIESLHQSSEGEEQEATNEDDDEAANSDNNLASSNVLYPINVDQSFPLSLSSSSQPMDVGNDDIQVLNQPQAKHINQQNLDERHFGQFAAEVLESHNYVGHLNPGEEVKVVR